MGQNQFESTEKYRTKDSDAEPDVFLFWSKQTPFGKVLSQYKHFLLPSQVFTFYCRKSKFAI